jgi:hypothetical protein
MKLLKLASLFLAVGVLAWGCGSAGNEDAASAGAQSDGSGQLGELAARSMLGGTGGRTPIGGSDANNNDNKSGILNGNDNGNTNDNGDDNTNDNGDDNTNDNGDDNTNDNGNGNTNDNGNGNDNGGGDFCADGSIRLRADDMAGYGDAEGELRYRWLPGGCERFRVKLKDFPPGVYDVFINDVVVAQVVTDSDGDADVEFDTEDGTFPMDFPEVFAGDVGDIGGLVSGVLLNDCSTTPDICGNGNGNTNGNDNGNTNGNDNGNTNGNDNGR